MLDPAALKQCSVVRAVEAFDMRDTPKGRPTRVKAGDSFWVAGTSLDCRGITGKGAVAICREGKSRRYNMPLTELAARFEVKP